MLEFQRTAIPDVILVKPRRLDDERGFFSEVYSRRDFAEIGLALEFVQDNHARSVARGTVRGLHFQLPPHAQDKLIRVTRGAVFDVAVDLRRSSPTFGRHVAVELSEANWSQLFVPAGFAHGYCTLTAEAEVLYKASKPYSAEHDRGLAWDDPALGIAWPVTADDAILSEKDRRHPPLSRLAAALA